MAALSTIVLNRLRFARRPMDSPRWSAPLIDRLSNMTRSRRLAANPSVVDRGARRLTSPGQVTNDARHFHPLSWIDPYLLTLGIALVVLLVIRAKLRTHLERRILHASIQPNSGPAEAINRDGASNEPARPSAMRENGRPTVKPDAVSQSRMTP